MRPLGGGGKAPTTTTSMLLKPNTNTNQPARISPADLIPMTVVFSCSCIQDQQPELRVIGSIICVHCSARCHLISLMQNQNPYMRRGYRVKVS